MEFCFVRLKLRFQLNKTKWKIILFSPSTKFHQKINSSNNDSMQSVSVIHSVPDTQKKTMKKRKLWNPTRWKIKPESLNCMIKYAMKQHSFLTFKLKSNGMCTVHNCETQFSACYILYTMHQLAAIIFMKCFSCAHHYSMKW